MSYYAYTILECSNPELISSGSAFVNESYSKLLKIQNGKSHFITNKTTMDGEIFELSIKYPDETFTAEWYWDSEYYDSILYHFSCKNGKFTDLGIKPGYVFNCPENQILDKDHYSAFKDHVIKYLERLDLINEKDGDFIIDKLNNRKDQYGYESYITITYENAMYKWTAKKKWISWIEVTCEKKEPEIGSLSEMDTGIKNSTREDYDDIPF
jgi:hypothetical protein